MLCDFYNSSLEFQENLLVKYYTKIGHEVVVIASTYESVFDYYSGSSTSREASVSHDLGAKVIKLPYRFNIFNRLRAYTSIFQTLRDERPDLIFVHDIMLNILECVEYVRTTPDCKMILDYHADYSNSGKNILSLKLLHGVIRKWFLDQARPYLQRIFPVVPAGIEFLHEIYGVPKEEMEVLPLGADIDSIDSISARIDRAEIRTSLGFAETDIVIFTGGKLEPRKRLEELFLAVEKLDGLPIHIIVAGRAGNSFQEYEEALRSKAKCMNNVHFLGWLGSEEIYKHMLSADLAVFPASQSILWQRAIACGLPLICGNTGSQDIDYLNDGNIISLPLKKINPDDISECIYNIVTDPALMATMKDKAKQVAKSKLDWNHLIERTLQFN